MQSTLTEVEWDSFVKDHCLDDEMKKISYQELMENTNNGQVDLSKLTLLSTLETAPELEISRCTLAIGYVVVDVVGLAIGAVGIRSSINVSSVEKVADIVAPQIPKILKNVEIIAESGASVFEQAKACWGIISVTLRSPFKILEAIYSSMSFFDKAYAIAKATAIIAAALLTDGAALIAEIVVELINFGTLVSDSIDAVSACSTS